MDTDLETKIQSKQIELEEAQNIIEKYSAIVPLGVNTPIEHNANEMKKDYDNYNRIREECMSLMRQRRDSK